MRAHWPLPTAAPFCEHPAAPHSPTGSTPMPSRLPASLRPLWSWARGLASSAALSSAPTTGASVPPHLPGAPALRPRAVGIPGIQAVALRRQTADFPRDCGHISRRKTETGSLIVGRTTEFQPTLEEGWGSQLHRPQGTEGMAQLLCPQTALGAGPHLSRPPLQGRPEGLLGADCERTAGAEAAPGGPCTCWQESPPRTPHPSPARQPQPLAQDRMRVVRAGDPTLRGSGAPTSCRVVSHPTRRWWFDPRILQTHPRSTSKHRTPSHPSLWFLPHAGKAVAHRSLRLSSDLLTA